VYDQNVVLDVLNLLVIVYNVVANRGGCMLDQNIVVLLGVVSMSDHQNVVVLLRVFVPQS